MIPREWVFHTEGGPAIQIQIVLPAAGPNVRRVLTHITARIINTGGAVVFQALRVLDGGTVVFQQNVVSRPNDISEFPFDIILIGSPGLAMTVQFATPASPLMLNGLIIRGHDL